MQTIVIPTFNEGPNVEELVSRIEKAMTGRTYEVLFVDDSVDDTPQIIERVAAASSAPVRLLHRDNPENGLSGAVVEGISAAHGDVCVVMDGDLQHPPELLPTILDATDTADVVVASRRIAGGDDAGLADARRKAVSYGATALARTLFPRRLAECTDPMTGYFAVKRHTVDVERLRPRGFKILLEVLCRDPHSVTEVPLRFGERGGGESKATAAQGMRFLSQLFALRFERVTRFALIGAVGAVANLLIMAALVMVGTGYVVAALTAALVTIVGNFLAQERWVFADRRLGPWWRRAVGSMGFNAVEAGVRLPVLMFLVEFWLVSSVLAQGLTLAVAFVVRYAFHEVVVYRRATPRMRSIGRRRTPEISTGSTTEIPSPVDEPVVLGKVSSTESPFAA
jgi:dolichol-phosphate mannosyltransferase